MDRLCISVNHDDEVTITIMFYDSCWCRRVIIQLSFINQMDQLIWIIWKKHITMSL